jgi:large subunit ribosomal protein L17
MKFDERLDTEEQSLIDRAAAVIATSGAAEYSLSGPRAARRRHAATGLPIGGRTTTTPMRHNKHHASLGVTREHRAAMLSNLAVSLIEHGRIKTTLTKAKAFLFLCREGRRPRPRGPWSPPRRRTSCISAASPSAMRDEAAIASLFYEKCKEFANRPGGYTRIYKLSQQRQGDAAEMALIEVIKADDVGYKKSKGRKAASPAEASAPAEEAPAAAAPAASA